MGFGSRCLDKGEFMFVWTNLVVKSWLVLFLSWAKFVVNTCLVLLAIFVVMDKISCEYQRLVLFQAKDLASTYTKRKAPPCEAVLVP